MWRSFIWVLVTAGLASAQTTASEDAPVQQFFAQYCFDCHGQGVSEGKIDLESLVGISQQNAAVWHKVLAQLERSEMPPFDHEQPPVQQRRQITKQVQSRMLSFYRRAEATRQTSPALRRLNDFEYRNTIRDLLDVDVSLWNPSELFPKDEGAGEFGRQSPTSDYLLKEYLAAASAALERAIYPAQRPETIMLIESPPPPHRKQVALTRQSWEHITQDYQVIFVHGHGNRGCYVPFPGLDKEGVPVAGRYRMTLTVSYHDHPQPFAEVEHDPAQRPAIALNATPAGLGLPTRETDHEKTLAETSFPDDGEKHTLVFETWLEANWIPRVEWVNGPTRTPKFNDAPKYFPGEAIFQDKSRMSNAEKGEYIRRMTRFLATDYRGPTVRLHDFRITGPLWKQYPPASHQALLGTKTWATVDEQNLIRKFASRAFRRPVDDGEVAPILALIDRQLATGYDRETALRSGLRAVLASPQFLFLENNVSNSDFALAARLSYFLWSSMPDATLMDLAASGRLRQPSILRQETERMLNDPKSDAFVEHFTDRWLKLHRIGTMPPDEKGFGSAYHLHELDRHMIRETRLFFRHLLDENLPVARFIDSDFTFLNAPLARLYGIEGVDWRDVRRVALTDPRRGGLLGQASVLTASANGIDTSPVMRGKWVLENLLGTPPGLPPESVPAIEPDARGTTTLREQLAAHRSSDACAGCHRRIDPYGFALERFNPIGGWRSDEGWDTSGTTYDGQSFDGVVGLKRILLGRQRFVARSLAEKLVAYAIGRPLRFTDREHIQIILDQARGSEYGLRSLIDAIVQSRIFLSD